MSKLYPLGGIVNNGFWLGGTISAIGLLYLDWLEEFLRLNPNMFLPHWRFHLCNGGEMIGFNFLYLVDHLPWMKANIYYFTFFANL